MKGSSTARRKAGCDAAQRNQTSARSSPMGCADGTSPASLERGRNDEEPALTEGGRSEEARREGGGVLEARSPAANQSSWNESGAETSSTLPVCTSSPVVIPGSSSRFS